MQHSQRLDQKLYTLREEVRTMSREKEQVEKVWRERLQRCERQLQAKEDEMIRQSQYFESFKGQLQYKLKQGRDREEALQNRIYTLEKQLLDMTVTAATGLATTGPVRITAGSITQWEEQDILPSLRGEGEGEEEKKEERKKQWPKGLEDERRSKDSDQARLQGFILSLQEDLRVLLEREEKAMTEHRELMEQLHEAQESSHFLGCKVEEMKSEIDHLNLSKVSLEEEMDELREENQRLQQSLIDSDNLPNNREAFIQKVQISDEEQLSVVLPDRHQSTAESSHNSPVDPSIAAKSETSLTSTHEPQTVFGNFGSKSNPSFQSLTLTTETIDELRMGAWCYNGVLNLEESPGEDCDALREAYRSLGLGGDLDFIKEQRDRFEEALQQTHEQLKMTLLENASLKSQIKLQEETVLREESSKDALCENSTLDDSARFSIGSDDLVQSLNEENRALAERIQELRDHIELREEEIMKERSEVKEQICRLEIDGARQQQEINEQACLVTELTKKTEDDLNIIMELQQKLVEYEELKEEIRRKKLFGFQSKHTQTVFRKDNIDECVDIVVNCVIESDKEPQFLSKQGNVSEVSQTTGKSDNPEVNLMNEEVDRLTKLVQSLKTEQEDLMGRIKTQRLQQKEVAQSIRAQTEEKQHLTREVWGLKEEKDHIFKSLTGLKQEREVLTRAVCGFKDEKDQFQRSMADLRKEKEQLFQDLPNLKRKKDVILETISSGIKERDQIVQSIQNLQKESLQLNQALLKLKQEKDELSSHLKSLKETKDKEHLFNNLEEECAKLQKSVSSLKEEERRMTFSVSRLKQEENQMGILIQQLQEEHSRLQATSQGQTKASEMDPTYAANEYEEQYGYKNNLKDQNDLAMQIQTLSTELQKAQDELDQTKAERQRLQSELFQSETKRDEAERRASQLADRLFKITDESNQLQETRKETENLKAQVKDLQNKVTGLTREKNEVLALKTQIDEQYNILSAQLRAKTVALQELNSEYISLKHGQGIREDLSTALVSMQSRYSDIRAKYDALLHKKSQADMDIAPLKAKLSCMVVKCQERNNILVQMTKILQKHGCIDYILKQQVEQLLADPALQSYASTFTTGFTPEITVTFEDTKRFTQDQTGSTSPSKQQQINEFTSQSNIYGGGRSPSLITPALSTFANSPIDCTSKMSHVTSPAVKAFSSRSISPLPEHREVMGSMSPTVSHKHNSQFLLSPTNLTRKENHCPSPVQEKISSNLTSPRQEHQEILGSTSPAASQKRNTNLTKHQLSPRSPRGSVLKTNEFQQLNVKAKSTPDLTRLTESSGFGSSSGSSSSLTCFGSNTRLSSPGKIMSLQEQLQKTLLSSFQAPAGRGKGQQPRKCLSFSAQSLAFPTASQMKKPTAYNATANITTSSSQSTSGETTKPVPSNNKLFNAVISRSATVTFSPVAQSFKQSKYNLSRASSNVSTTTSALQSKAVITASSGAIKHAVQELKASSMENDTTFLHVSPTATDCNVFPNTTESTASDTVGPSKSNSFNRTQVDGGGSLIFPQPTSMSAKKSPNCAEKARTPTRIKQEAPAEVRSIEVIKTVGVSGLMISWERPPLDELGCSNGTFVYGYRVFVDGVFHKSIMSSACTKCILENVNLSVPIKISVQTLGSNGLSSNCVHTMHIQKDL
ncbi:trichohyalin-like [Boleophthalmus pectinirostris]|uniref:trichohyalin-like n=1 Tax=Boleophthalmus pectinirostris TaxID=150288 RepID=UPI00242ABC58|nr:trichohyalin-like [Boleophthalmus pectinirostris]